MRRASLLELGKALSVRMGTGVDFSVDLGRSCNWCLGSFLKCSCSGSTGVFLGLLHAELALLSVCLLCCLSVCLPVLLPSVPFTLIQPNGIPTQISHHRLCLL